jgi:hypothetical protein
MGVPGSREQGSEKLAQRHPVVLRAGHSWTGADCISILDAPRLSPPVTLVLLFYATPRPVSSRQTYEISSLGRNSIRLVYITLT